MKKKIAMLLILFMVGSWCSFAEGDETDYTMVWILLGGLGVLTITGMIIVAVSGGSADDIDAVRRSGGFGYEGKQSSNPIFEHGLLGVTNDKVFIGVHFSF